MKFIFSFIFTVLFLPVLAKSQQRKAMTYQQQVQSQRVNSSATQSIAKTDFRFLANFEYAAISPNALNTFRTQDLWLGTPAAQDTFSNLSGFSVGAGYFIGNGFLGLEYSHGNQQLGAATTSGTTTVQDTIELDTLQVVYDLVFQNTAEQSLELGIGLGQAVKFQYNNIFNSVTGYETLTWKDTPFVFKLRAFYNYHFSENVRLRFGLAYEGLKSNNLKADADHPNINYYGSTVTSGLNLHDINNNNVTVDLSGIRASAGLVVAF